MLTEKQRAVVEYYYNDDLSLGEIGANEGISRQGVRDAIKRAEAQLLDMEERLGLAKRFRVMKDGLEKIYLAAADIQEWNEEKIQSPAVREKHPENHGFGRCAGGLAPPAKPVESHWERSASFGVEGLAEILANSFKRLRSKGKLSEADVKEAMREVRLALLEADVNYKVAKDFTIP